MVGVGVGVSRRVRWCSTPRASDSGAAGSGECFFFSAAIASAVMVSQLRQPHTGVPHSRNGKWTREVVAGSFGLGWRRELKRGE